MSRTLEYLSKYQVYFRYALAVTKLQRKKGIVKVRRTTVKHHRISLSVDSSLKDGQCVSHKVSSLQIFYHFLFGRTAMHE